MTEALKDQFWADQAAREVSNVHNRFVVATGISPSGQIHIGNMREVVTADAVVRALKDLRKEVELIYIADDFDPLRRVYPFLDPQKYEAHVGRPLSEVPSPADPNISYAEHFLKPFLDALKVLDIRVRVERASEMYKSGRYTQNIVRAMEATDRIRQILKDETGKESPPEWSPFNPICEKDGRMVGTTVLGFDAAAKTVSYKCLCGHQGVVPMAGGGKLTWRVDWPARWQILGVTVEPFGKDHASKGGSYDTGIRIAREVFEYEPPFPVVYEWISLKGAGDMSSSKGNVIAVHDMLEVVPPDVLKYAVLKVIPNRRIVFDPQLPLLSLIDEYDDRTSKSRVSRAAELASITGTEPLGIPFRHIVSLVQTNPSNDVRAMIPLLKRNGYEVKDEKILAARAAYARKWLDRFGPEDVRFSLQETLPEAAKSLSDAQKRALIMIAQGLRDGMTGEEVHLLIYSTKDACGLTPQTLFEAIYLSLLGKPKGPRAGFFLASLDAAFVRKRFEECGSSTS